MSFFTTINFESVDHDLNNSNQHQSSDLNTKTTELQIENGLAIYDDAMRLFDLKLYKEAINKFNMLLSMDIFRMDNEASNCTEIITEYLYLVLTSDSDPNESEQSIKSNDEDNSEFEESDDSTSENEWEVEEHYSNIIPEFCSFNFSYRSEKLDNLRYLAFRNFSLLLYTYLSEEIENETETRKVNWKNFVYCLKHILVTSLKCLSFRDVFPPDTKLVELLLNFFISFKSKKLTRNFIETVVCENPYLLTSKRLLPKWKKLISIELITLDLIHDYSLDLSEILNYLQLKQSSGSTRLELEDKLNISKVFQYLTKYVDSQNDFAMNCNSTTAIDINVDYYRWNTLVQEIYNIIPSETLNYDFKKENPDPYNGSDIDEAMSRLIFKTNPLELSAFNRQKNITLTNVNTSEQQKEQELELKDLTITKLPETDTGFVHSITLKRKASVVAEKDDEQQQIKRVSRRVRNHNEESQKLKNPIVSSHEEFLSNFNEVMSNSEMFSSSTTDIIKSMNFRDFLMLSELKNFQYSVHDLYDCFESWDKTLSKAFIGDSNDKNRNNTGIDDSEIVIHSDVMLIDYIFDKLSENENLFNVDNNPKLYNEGYFSFLKNVTDNNVCHYQQVRIYLLKTLLIDNYNKDSKCLITDLMWPTKMLIIVNFFVLCLHEYFLKHLSPRNHQDYLLAISIYEILIDNYLKKLKELRRLKHKSGELFDSVNILQERIESWSYMFFRDSEISKQQFLSTKDEIRIKWADLIYEKSFYDDKFNNFSRKFDYLQKKVNEMGSSFSISYVNYEEIPSVSEKTFHVMALQKQLSSDDIQLNYISLILEIFQNPSSFMEQHNDSSSWQYSMAKSLLSFKDEYKKLELWCQIFNYLKTKEKVSANDIETCFDVISNLVVEFLESESYTGKTTELRREYLLKILNEYYNILKTYCEHIISKYDMSGHLSGNNFESSEKRLTVASKILALVFTYFNYETVLINDNTDCKPFYERAKSSSKKWKSFLAYAIVFFISSIKRYVENKNSSKSSSYLLNLISVFHKFMSTYECCAAGDKIFLRYCQLILFKVNAPETKPVLDQLVFCCHNIDLSEELEQHAVPDNENDIEGVDAYFLSTYVMQGYTNQESMLLNLFKSPILKSDIGKIVNAISWRKYTSRDEVHSNRKNLDLYLSNTLKKSFVLGEFDEIELKKTNTTFEEIVGTNIILALCINFLSLYYQRKQKKMDCSSFFTGLHGLGFNTISHIVELLEANIIFNGAKFESWYLLGECFNICAENDLNFHAEKVNSIFKADVIRENYRKAFLCFGMATKFINSDSPSHYSFFIRYKLAATLSTYVSPPLYGAFGDERNLQNEVVNIHVNPYSSDRLFMYLISVWYYKEAYTQCIEYDWNDNFNNTDITWKTALYFIKFSVISDIPFTNKIEVATQLCKKALKTQKFLNVAFRSLIQCIYTSISNFGLIKSENVVNDSNECIKLSLQTLLGFKGFFKGMDSNIWKISPDLPVNLKLFKRLLIFFAENLLTNEYSSIGEDFRIRLLIALMYKDMGDYSHILQVLEAIMSLSSPVKPLFVIQREELEEPGSFFLETSYLASILLTSLKKENKIDWFPFILRKLRRSNNKLIGNVRLFKKGCSIYMKLFLEKYKMIPQESISSFQQADAILTYMIENEVSVNSIPSYNLKKNDDNNTELNFASKDTLSDIFGIHEFMDENSEFDATTIIWLFSALVLEPYRIHFLKNMNKELNLSNLKYKTDDTDNPKKALFLKIGVFLKKCDSRGELYKPSI